MLHTRYLVVRARVKVLGGVKRLDALKRATHAFLPCETCLGGRIQRERMRDPTCSPCPCAPMLQRKDPTGAHAGSHMLPVSMCPLRLRSPCCRQSIPAHQAASILRPLRPPPQGRPPLGCPVPSHPPQRVKPVAIPAGRHATRHRHPHQATRRYSTRRGAAFQRSFRGGLGGEGWGGRR